VKRGGRKRGAKKLDMAGTQAAECSNVKQGWGDAIKNATLIAALLLLVTFPSLAKQLAPDASKKPPAQNEPYPVKIVSQPSPDGWYIAYVLITGLALFVGAGTLFAIWRQTTRIGDQVAQMIHAGEQTDRLIEQAIRQADASIKSSEAAILNVKAFINSERAHLLIKQIMGNEIPRGKPAFVQFKNFGPNPAWISSADGSFQWVNDISELAPIPEYGDAKLDGNGLVLPGEDSNFMHISHQVGPAPDNARQVRLAIYGVITYRDRFRSGHFLKFCFVSIGPNHFSFEQAGPDAYNSESS
jgi:hypothetical protein